MRNGAIIYAMLLTFEVTHVLNVAIPCSVKMESGKEFYSVIPKSRHELVCNRRKHY